MLIIYILLLAIITVIGMKTAPHGQYLDDYMSRERTTSVKGFFAVIIVFSHMTQYLDTSSFFDSLYAKILWLIGQFMVTMFFFYSGYGILESVKKRSDYFKGFFTNRIIKTLIHFDLAVLLFLILNTIIEKKYPVEKTLAAFIGWESIGNSNWFIFCTIALYFATLAAFAVFKKSKWLAAISTTLLTLALIIFLSYFKQSHWYNTLLCYPLGMFYSLAKNKIDALFSKKKWCYHLSLWSCAAITALLPAAYALFSLDVNYQVLYLIMSCTFTLFIVFASMKISANNKILYWLGVNSFSIYILQRLPMIVLKHFGFDNNNLIFSLIAIAATMIIAPLFTLLTNLIDKLLFKRKNQKQSVSNN